MQRRPAASRSRTALRQEKNECWQDKRFSSHRSDPFRRRPQGHRVPVKVLLAGYVGLFLAAFGAGTLLPLLPKQSEVVLVGLLLNGRYSVGLLLGIATVGNVLGSMVNWQLGRSVERFKSQRWFPVKRQHLESAQRHYQRYGYWSLLFSWLPFIGDSLTLVAGILREPLWRFALIVALAKGGRYGVLMLLAAHWV